MKGQKNDISPTVFPVDHNLALLGHELGNVLNGLLGMADLLSESDLSTDQDRWIKAIKYSGKQLQSLIEAASHEESDSGLNIVPQRVRMDGIALLEQVVISHTPAACRQNNQLVLVTDPGLPRYWFCDACLVRQLLDNLVANAIKFTRDGVIVVEVKSVTAAKPGGELLEFRVRDSGQGMGDQEGKRIFRAYQSCHPSQGNNPEGRGLGLFICDAIVRAMNGSISCFSQKAGGTCFAVGLPESLEKQDNCPPVLRSSVLSQLRCELGLAKPLRRSVKNFLARLGVRWSTYGAVEPADFEHELVLVIGDMDREAGCIPRGLVLSPRPDCVPALSSRVLEFPVLESSLGLALLELALEWRSLVIRNGKPDSTPEQR